MNRANQWGGMFQRYHRYMLSMILYVAVMSCLPQLGLAQITGESSLSSPAGVVKIFHQALKNGHKDVVISVLREDVKIFEGSTINQSAQDYARNHLDADIRFLSQVETRIVEQQIEKRDDVAMSTSRFSMKGSADGKSIDRTQLETLILTKTPSGWKIVHIHWSH